MPTGWWMVAYVAFVVLVAVESVLLVAVLRQVMLLHGHFVVNDPNVGLPLGALAPRLSGTDLFGRPVSLADARGKKTLLVFLSTGCASCRPVMAMIPSLPPNPGVELVLLLGAGELQARLFLEEHWRGVSAPPFAVVLDPRDSLGARYRVAGVPHAVVVDEDGRVGAQGAVAQPSDVAFLLDQADELRRRRWSLGHAGERAARAPAAPMPVGGPTAD